MVRLLVVAGLLWGVLMGSARGQESDCKQALVAAEMMVCQDPELLSQERAITHLYQRILERGDAAIRAEQESWLAERKRCCDISCVKSLQNYRLQALQSRFGVMMEYGTAAGQEWQDPVTGIVFVWVPGGTFQMGCGSWSGECRDDETPAHTVRVDGFWLGKYEVSQGEWKRLMGKNPSRYALGENYPVDNVSWLDVQQFIEKNELINNVRYRLPSSAEWEYACRSGGKEELYAGGEDLATLAWYRSNSGRHPHPVGQKRPNGLGLHDMSGNGWEWVEDAYSNDFYATPQAILPNPVNRDVGSGLRVFRGGSWGSEARNLRCTAIHSDWPNDRPRGNGSFRLVREVAVQGPR
ncbi:SUMF1/EgtB/PvdO family nonheme iron enzyme [Candidatus Magnetaquicoccus inordinatus]|uniref:SUMF1/EgtB/PvdO family nonheme iron enzyme n=1 Tax=Candidatus Magnetaquicoccus inordinatus TaxID=2496818 RepID=UPI00102C5609|nr:SUMF1/EgtB/PvdO family nonheme iron enzyme [Candidatus Magnetaquicoccus inordinatus]